MVGVWLHQAAASTGICKGQNWRQIMPSRAVASTGMHEIWGWEWTWQVNLGNSPVKPQFPLGSTTAGAGDKPDQAGLQYYSAFVWVQFGGRPGWARL